MSQRHVCGSHGWLVAADGFIPESEFDYQTPALEMRVGCNRVQCTQCKSAVKHRVGYQVAPGSGIVPQLYVTDDWSRWIASGDLRVVAYARLYHCRCQDGFAVGETNLAPEEDRPDPVWECGGHPPLRLPAKVDGIALGENADFVALARSFYDGSLVGKQPAIALWKADWINRLHGVLLGEPAAARLADAVFALLGDEQPVVIAAASTFFALFPDAAGAERLSAFFIEHRDRLEAILNPGVPGGTLRYWFLQAIAARITHTRGGDREAVAIGRSEVQVGAKVPRVLTSALRGL